MNYTHKTTYTYKVFFSILLTSLFYVSSFSQCKLDKTNDGYIQSKEITIADIVELTNDKISWSLELKLLKSEDDRVFILISNKASGNRAYAIRNIDFHFSDGSTFSKSTSVNQSKEMKIWGGYTEKLTFFQIDKVELEKLSKSQLDYFKTNFIGFQEYPNEYEESISKKIADKINKTSNCILLEFKE